MNGAFSRHCAVIHVVGLATIVALTSAWFILGIRPLMNATQRAATLAGQTSEFREDIHARVVRRDERAVHHSELARELAAMTVRLRPATAVNAQLAEITRLAETHQIRVERIEPGTPVDTPLAVRVPMKIAGRGSSPDAVRFLAELRTRFPDIAVDGFEMTSGTGEVDAALRFDCVWYADRVTERKATADASR